jgi:hypothetical protein
MPMSSGARRLVHYGGYLHPILMIAAGFGCLVALALWYNSGEPVETEGVFVLGLLGAAGLGFGTVFLWQHSKRDPAAPIQIVDDLPPAEGARQTRNLMWIVGIVLTLGAAFTAYQLAQVASGPARSATVWAPVALMYEMFGFWPAALFLPAAGLLIILALARKLRAIKEGQTGRI